MTRIADDLFSCPVCASIDFHSFRTKIEMHPPTIRSADHLQLAVLPGKEKSTNYRDHRLETVGGRYRDNVLCLNCLGCLSKWNLRCFWHCVKISWQKHPTTNRRVLAYLRKFPIKIVSQQGRSLCPWLFVLWVIHHIMFSSETVYIFTIVTSTILSCWWFTVV